MTWPVASARSWTRLVAMTQAHCSARMKMRSLVFMGVLCRDSDLFHQGAPLLFEVNAERDQKDSGNYEHRSRAGHRAEEHEIDGNNVERDEQDPDVDHERRTFLNAGLNLE